jgi:phosphoribosylformylglycinamidine synthase
MWQFAEAVAGIGDACRALRIPITGGNVSLYNETDGRAILPTPVIGVVGLIEDASQVRTRVFPAAGMDIVLFGRNRGELGGSEYLKTICGLLRGRPPALDLQDEANLQRLIVDLTRRGLVGSLHDCAEGGVAVSLAECCFEGGGVGADVSLPPADTDGSVDLAAATLFGESATRVIASVSPAHLQSVLDAANSAGVPATHIGRTGGSRVTIRLAGETVVDVPLSEAEAAWSESIQMRLEKQAG